MRKLGVAAVFDDIERLFKLAREGELDPRLQYILAIPCSAFIRDILYDGLCVIAEKPIIKCLEVVVPEEVKIKYRDMGEELIALDTETLPAPVRNALVSSYEARKRMEARAKPVIARARPRTHRTRRRRIVTQIVGG